MGKDPIRPPGSFHALGKRLLREAFPAMEEQDIAAYLVRAADRAYTVTGSRPVPSEAERLSVEAPSDLQMGTGNVIDPDQAPEPQEAEYVAVQQSARAANNPPSVRTKPQIAAATAHAPDSDASGSTPDHQRHKNIYYYQRPRIIVTRHYIENAEGRYAIRDLSDIARVYEAAHPTVTVALICGVIQLLIAVPLALAYGSAIMLAAGVLVATGLAAALIYDGRRNPRWMALRAVHCGRETTLFTSRNLHEFEQVHRAVIRAVEANRQPRL